MPADPSAAIWLPPTNTADPVFDAACKRMFSPKEGLSAMEAVQAQLDGDDKKSKFHEGLAVLLNQNHVRLAGENARLLKEYLPSWYSLYRFQKLCEGAVRRMKNKELAMGWFRYRVSNP